MSGKNIATIYFYLVSAVSLGLIVVGIFNAANFVINSAFYDSYPLRYGPSTGCDSYPAPYKVISPYAETKATPSAQEVEKQKRDCEKFQEIDRREHRINDIKNTLTFTLVGIILFLIHFPQAKKYSKD